jgi:hypothetical protein
MPWDTQMYTLFGPDRKGFSGKYDDFLALVDSSDRRRLIEEIAVGLQKGKDFGSEFRIIPTYTRATRALDYEIAHQVDNGKGLRTENTERWQNAPSLKGLELAGAIAPDV